MSVLHASAVLAWLQQEPGTHLIDFADSHMTALDFGAVLDEAHKIDMDVDAVGETLTSMVKIVPIYALDVLEAAKLDPHLALADRLAIALADKLSTTLVTSDSLWT